MKNARKGDGNNKRPRAHRSRQGKLPRKYRRHQEGLVSKYDHRDTLIFGYTGEPVIQPGPIHSGDHIYYSAQEEQRLTENLSHDLKHALMYFGHEEDIYELPEDHGQWIDNENQDLRAIGRRGYEYDEYAEPEYEILRYILDCTQERNAISVEMSGIFSANEQELSKQEERHAFEEGDCLKLISLFKEETSSNRSTECMSNSRSVASSYRKLLKKSWSIGDAEILSRAIDGKAFTIYSCSDEVLFNLILSPLWNRLPKTLSGRSVAKKALYKRLYGTYDTPSFLLNGSYFELEPLALYVFMAKGFSIRELYGLLMETENYTKRITKCLWDISNEAQPSCGLKAACFLSNGVPMEIALAMAEIEIPCQATETIQWFQRNSDRVHPEDVKRINNYFRHVVDENGEQQNPFRAGYRRTIRATRAFDRATQRQIKQGRNGKQFFRDNNLAADYQFKRSGREVSFVQLLDGSQLVNEGQRMHHCVGFYSQSCSSGQSAIVSMCVNGKPALTIEICRQSKTVIEVRGKYNRSARVEEQAWIRLWANEKSLSYEA